MNAVNDFMAKLDFSVLMKYCAENGRRVKYAKGEPLVLEGGTLSVDGYCR